MRAEFVRLRNIANKIKPIMRQGLIGGLNSFRGSIDLREVVSLIESGAFNKIEQILPLDKLEQDLMKYSKSYEKAIDMSGKSGQEFFKRSVKQLIPDVPLNEFSWSVENPRIQRFIQQRTAQLVVDVSKQTKGAIKFIIEEGFRRGYPPRDLAKMIKQNVGLTQNQVAQVMNYQNKLESGLKGQLTEFQKKGMNKKDLENLGNLRRSRVNELVQNYADRQLKWRSENIARTESFKAVNYGQVEIWQQAEDQGITERGKTRKEWVVTIDDRLCPICEPMDGLTAQMGEDFVTGDGTSISAPPAHPSCRCHVALVFID